MISLQAHRGRISLQLEAMLMGRDLSVALSGGDRPHIGAVALSQARASQEEAGATRASTSVLAILGHREEDLARAVASRLASELDTTVCVACGIHVDGILKAEFQEIAAMVEELTLQLLQRLKAPSGSPPAWPGIPPR